MIFRSSISDYRCRDAGHTFSYVYLLPALEAKFKTLEPRLGGVSTFLDLGYGNGIAAAALAERAGR